MKVYILKIFKLFDAYTGPVLMDTRGLTEKGVKRKAAVQALFSKLLYLSEVIPSG